MNQKLKTTLFLVFVIPYVLVALPIMLIWLSVESLLLRIWFWFNHKRHGRDVILITSESPIWSDYIRENILPRVENRALVMNWTERRFWRQDMPIAARAYQRWSGEKGMVPSVILVRGFWKIENFSLYQAFRDYKHGKQTTLREIEDKLLSTLRE